MFSNILRISAANVLKMLLKVIVSIWVCSCYFSVVQTNRKHKYALLNWPLPGLEKKNIIINFKKI